MNDSGTTGKNEMVEDSSLIFKVIVGNDEWTYPDADMLKVGQHAPKFEGSWGYVEYELINGPLSEIFRKLCKEKIK